LLLGLAGVVIVLYDASSWEGVISIKGLAWLSFSLFGIVAGTLIQKRFGQNIDLITGASYQYAASLLFFAVFSFSIESGKVDWSFEFILTLSWLVIVLSMISILLLLYMIRHGEATKVASYFYLTPPLAAFWGWLFFDEQWSWITLIGAGFVIAALILIRPMSKK